MDYHGVKIDFLGLAAVITALATLYSKVKSNAKKKEAEHGKKDAQED